MSDDQDWALPARMIRASGGNLAAVIARALERGLGAAEIEAALWVAADKMTERGDEDPDFDDYAAIPPGSLDLRVWDQGDVWVDVLRTKHDLVAMSDCYVLNLIGWNRRWAQSNHAAYSRDAAAADVSSDEWLEGTVLFRALIDEAVRRGP